MNSSRHGSVELLRSLLMFFVVVWHCACHGLWAKLDSFEVWGYSFLMWHVPAFVAISGWFGVRFKPSKFLRLYGLVFLYSVLGWMYGIFVEGHGVDLLYVRGGWFAGAYFVLMLVADFVNEAIERISARRLLGAWLLMTFACVVNWLPYVKSCSGISTDGIGGVGGASFFALFYVYVTTRLIRRGVESQWFEKMVGVWSPKLVGRVFVIVCGCYALAFSVCCLIARTLFHGVNCYKIIELNSYLSPQVILFAIALVVLFVEGSIMLPAWMNRVALFVSPSAFGIYLLHECTPFGRNLYLVPERYLSDVFHLPIWLNILLSGIIVFLIALLCDLVRRMIMFYPMRLSLNQFLERLDNHWTRVVGVEPRRQ